MNNIEFILMMARIFALPILAPFKIKGGELDDTFENTFEVYFVAHDLDGKELPKRDVKVRVYNGKVEVSHGLHSNSMGGISDLLMADNIQNVVVGEVSKELLMINK